MLPWWCCAELRRQSPTHSWVSTEMSARLRGVPGTRGVSCACHLEGWRARSGCDRGQSCCWRERASRGSCGGAAWSSLGTALGRGGQERGQGWQCPGQPRERPGASQHQLPPPLPSVIHAGARVLTFLRPARSSYILLLPFCCKIMDFFFLCGMCKEF